MFEALEALYAKRDELLSRMNNPSAALDPREFAKISKEHASLDELLSKYDYYKKTLATIAEYKEELSGPCDAELAELMRQELPELSESLEATERELRIMLLPKDPNDSKNVFIEIRGGTGGDEAALFAYDLYRMYTRYAERKGWKYEIVSLNENDLGGFKEVIVSLKGQGAYSRMKFESGVHRVQRVPETESGGRIHTSAATVAVLPELEDVDVKINDDDIRIDVYRSSGAGGQHVNKTSSAIRITHIPTGIVVQCQNERSQYQNKDVAFSMLRAKLYELQEKSINDAQSSDRKAQVGSGDRSEKIRTYNYPQSRVTDHRIGFTTHRLDVVMDGDLDIVLDELILAHQTKLLEENATNN